MSNKYADINEAFKNQCNACVNLVKNPYLDLGYEKLYSMHCSKGINPSDIVNIKCKEYINMISNK